MRLGFEAQCLGQGHYNYSAKHGNEILSHSHTVGPIYGPTHSLNSDNTTWVTAVTDSLVDYTTVCCLFISYS